MKKGILYIGKLIPAIAILFASLGVPVHSYTCLASGTTHATMVVGLGCCGKMDTKSTSNQLKSGCCLYSSSDYQYLDSEIVIPTEFDVEKVNPAGALLSVLIVQPAQVPIELPALTDSKVDHPPPLSNRDVHRHYSTFLI